MPQRKGGRDAGYPRIVLQSGQRPAHMLITASAGSPARPWRRSGATHIGVAAPLAPEGAFRAMAGDENRLVAHGPEALGDAVDELFVVALGEVGAANAAGKKHVAHKRTVDLRGVEHHMAGRVAGAMAHLQYFVADLHLVAIVQPAGGCEGERGREAEHGALLRQAVNPELVARVRAHDG